MRKLTHTAFITKCVPAAILAAAATEAERFAEANGIGEAGLHFHGCTQLNQRRTFIYEVGDVDTLTGGLGVVLVDEAGVAASGVLYMDAEDALAAAQASFLAAFGIKAAR